MPIKLGLLLLAIAAACSNGGYLKTSRYSGTSITPDYFRFATIVEAGDEPHFGGGWRAVCISASVSQGVHDYRTGTERRGGQRRCEVEFGAPILLATGETLSLRDTQRAAADSANEAARSVITTTRRVTAATCERIRRQADRLFRRRIPGARASSCQGFRGMDVPMVRWP
jgi:hypothetical protein